LSATPAAAAACAASALSLAGFRFVTVAGATATLLVLFRAGRRASVRLRVVAALATLLFGVLVLTGPRPASSVSDALAVVLAVLAPAAVIGGIAVQAGDDARENRAARQVIEGTLVEHTARGERTRIARELHDVVAHHISMVAVQAESARLTVPGMPAAGARRLTEIGDTARTALVEMRRLLGVLRVDGAPGLHPQPGLAQLPALVDAARDAAGCSVRLIVRGVAISLDPSVELVAYRLAQEALSNVRRHAPGAAVDVELTFADAGVRLRVRDNGPGAPSPVPAGGNGLRGMHERAAAVGGVLRTGRAAGNGFVVEADLPARLEDPA
jgi:signal transduction histidine kinase